MLNDPLNLFFETAVSVLLISNHNSFQVKKGKGSPYSAAECRVTELIPVLGSPAGYVSHKPGSRLPLLFARPAVTLATLKKAATNFAAWWTEERWVWTVCLCLLPDSIAWVQHANHSATVPPTFQVLFDKVATVYFIWKIDLYFSIGNGQPWKLALRMLLIVSWAVFWEKVSTWVTVQHRFSETTTTTI